MTVQELPPLKKGRPYDQGKPARDAALVQELAAGRPVREVAAEFGLTKHYCLNLYREARERQAREKEE